MAGAVLIAAFLALFANIGFIEGFFPNSPTCSTRKVLITLDAPRYQYFPYFVEVYRCNGVCSTVSPNLQQCLAAAWNNITGAVLDLSSKSLKTVTVQNHTNCKCACVAKKEDCSENEEFNEGNCQCNCKYTDQPPSPCPAGFSWDQFQCKCVCRGPVDFCNVRQEWSQEACGCVCTRFAIETCKLEKKYLNASTCECETLAPTKINPGVTGKRSTEVMDWKRIAWVIVAELVILILLFDLYLCCRYEKGVLHWIFYKCRCFSKATTSENTEQANASRNLLNANRTNEDRGTSLSTSNGPENHSTSMNRSKSKESIVWAEDGGVLAK